MVQQVLKVQMAPQALKVLLAIQALLDLKALRAPKAQMVHKAQTEQQDLKVLKD